MCSHTDILDNLRVPLRSMLGTREYAAFQWAFKSDRTKIYRESKIYDGDAVILYQGEVFVMHDGKETEFHIRAEQVLRGLKRIGRLVEPKILIHHTLSKPPDSLLEVMETTLITTNYAIASIETRLSTNMCYVTTVSLKEKFSEKYLPTIGITIMFLLPVISLLLCLMLRFPELSL